MIGFDVAQFFPSINHELLIAICERRGLPPTFIRWLRAYFLPRSSTFRFGNDSSPPFECPHVGVGQGSALSPTFAGITASPLMFILHNFFRAHHDFRFSYFHMYVDDGNIMVSSPSIDNNLRLIPILYEIITTTLHRSGLLLEHEKTEAMHFIHTANSSQRPHVHAPITLPGLPHPIRPPDQLRHLGFWLDPHLSWKYHVSWYAHRASTTTIATRMLGSSTRGLLPQQRRRIYIACVLPVLTYGCQVWFREKGVKHLLKRLSTSQNLALRWISGHFRSAPVGSLETAAGVLPIHLYCRRLQVSYRLRVHTLMPSHPIKSLFPSRYPLVHNSPHAAFYPPLRTPRSHIYHTTLGSISSLPHVPDLPTVNAVCDRYDPTDLDCQPGNRVIDLFADHIHLNLSHPKKSDDDAIRAWICNNLQPRIDQAHADPNTIVIYTDGSATTDGANSSSGFVAYFPHHNVLTEQAHWSGRGFSFDAELIAILQALSHFISHSLATYHLHIFTDSESSAKSLFHTKKGRQQLLDINSTLRDWFSLSDRNHLHISYCPSHMGIEGNERVDRLIANLDPPPNSSPAMHSHFSYEKRRITVDTVRAWTELTVRPNPLTGQPEPDPAYWGRDYIHTPATHIFDPAQAGSFIRRFGKLSIVAFSRLARASVNHTCTGAYRAKFRAHAEEPTRCSCGYSPRGPETIHDRHHVFFECPFYYRGDITDPEHLLDLDPFPMILSFFSLNPGAFSFDDAPVDTTSWDNDTIDPRLEFLINLIGDLAMRHDSIRARLPIPDLDLTDSDLEPAAIVHAFKRQAHSRTFNPDLLPLLDLAHEFRQESRYRHYVKSLRARGHKYNISNDLFLTLRRRLLRTRNGRKSRHSFRRAGSAPPQTDDALCRALSPPSSPPSISDIVTSSDTP